MHAVFIEVNIAEEQAQQIRTGLQILDIPRLRAFGAVSAVILAPLNGRAVGVAVFESEENAAKVAGTIRQGGQAGPLPVARVRNVEVREVLARL